MPIVDNILIAQRTDETFKYPTTPLGDLIEQHIRGNIENHGDTAWMTDVSRKCSWTYSQMLDAARQMASALKKRGFEKGDSLIMMASNHIEVFPVFLAVWKLGGTVANLTLNLFPVDIENRANPITPKFIVTDVARAQRVIQARNNLKSVKEVFTIDGFVDGSTPLAALLADDGQDCPDEVAVDPMSPAILMFSSGTTGVPKAIVHIYRNFGAFAEYYSKSKMPNTRYLFINLVVNSGGTSVALSASLAHASLFTLSDYSGEDALLATINEVKPQMMSLFPTQIVWLCRHPSLNEYDLTSVSYVITAGSCLNPIYEKELYRKIPNLLALCMAYAMTETLLISMNSPSREELANMDKEKAIARHIVGTSGKLVDNCKLKVIDRDTGKVLGPGEVGEICVSTPYMLKEYRNQPEETAFAMRDGWFHTGDRGYYDTNENIFVVGRFKELIKYRVAHVVPMNIEKHLMTHPAVADAGVVGLPHDEDGERPLAFVVLKSGFEHVTADELVAFIDERVIDEERLRGGVRFIESIPRNDFGKVVRPKLQELAVESKS